MNSDKLQYTTVEALAATVDASLSCISDWGGVVQAIVHKGFELAAGPSVATMPEGTDP